LRLSKLDVTLLEIKDAVADLETVLNNVDRARLDVDVTKRLAVSMALLIVSDLVGTIQTKSPEFFDEHPEIEWSQIRAFRNRLAHDYFNLDLDIVWQAATVSIPALMATLEPHVPAKPDSAS
jgi:uncharacterized protein with HEPN domain